MVYDILAYARTRFPAEVLQRHFPDAKQRIIDVLADDPEAQRVAVITLERLVYTHDDIVAALGLTTDEFKRINERLQARYRRLLAELGAPEPSSSSSSMTNHQRITRILRRSYSLVSRFFG